jgi:hypothetical protein
MIKSPHPEKINPKVEATLLSSGDSIVFNPEA